MRRIAFVLLVLVAACCMYFVAHDRHGKDGRRAATVRTANGESGDSSIRNAASARKGETTARTAAQPVRSADEGPPESDAHAAAASSASSRAPERYSSPQPVASNRATIEQKPNRELLADLIADNEGSEDGGSANGVPPSLARSMHKRLQQQLPDPDWAPYAEQQIQRYFLQQNGDFFRRFEIPVVECRSSLCEIQAASLYPDDTPRDAEIWQRVVYDMLKEPWWPQFQFKEPAIQLSSSPDERRLLFVTYLIRQDAG